MLLNDKSAISLIEIPYIGDGAPSAMYYPSMLNVHIREATGSDAPAIIDLYRSAGIESQNSFTAGEACEHFSVFAKYPNYRIFVAVREQEIVGTYELLIMDNLAKRSQRSGVVEDVAVSPRYQGLGIGRALMLHAREQCREAGCYKFVLSSGLGREDAHAFYESTGLERHGFSFLCKV